MTNSEFKELVEKYGKLKAEIKHLDEQLSLVQEAARETERTLMAAMEELNLQNFAMDGVGTLYVQEKFSVKTPKLPEQKEAFFNYLRAIGEFDALISVNSQTLNAWYRSKMEEAALKGQEFVADGITEVGTYKQVVLRRS